MPAEQQALFLAFSVVFGLLIGSFLNVCIFRIPRNCMSVAGPRSHCPRCMHLIPWYDNLPVLSWLILRGRCRFCRASISPRYVLVELLTAALVGYAAWKQMTAEDADAFERSVRFGAHVVFVGAMIACTFIDMDFRILPDEITLPGTVLAMAVSAAFPVVHEGGLPVGIENEHLGTLAASALGALVGGGVIYAIGGVGKLVFRKEAMGFGDVKFMAMVGGILGWKGALLALLVACLLGSLYGVGRYAVVRRMGYVPFGPFLAAGALVMLFEASLVDQALRAYMDFVAACGPL